MSHCEQRTGDEAVAHLARRVKALKMSMSYQRWLESFKEPFTYDPALYKALGIQNDYVLYFDHGSTSSMLKMSVSFLCSLSKPLHSLIAGNFSCPLKVPMFAEFEAYAFWWIKKFLSSYCLMPNAEGLATILQVATKYEIRPIAHLTRWYLSTVVNLSSFPFVLNAAVVTNDDEFLMQCSCMIAAWTDELLSSPSISVLDFKAMINLLDNVNLSPSSELLVYNAIVNWARNNVDATVAEVAFCLRKVRFLLLTKEEFQQEVLPSGQFHIRKANEMIRILSGQPAPERQRRLRRVDEAAPFVPDSNVQRMARPVILGTLIIGKQLHEIEHRYLSYEATKSEEERPLCFFKVNKPILLRRVKSHSFLDECGGTLKFEEINGFQVNSPWKHCSCAYDKPLPLQPGASYHIAYSSSSGRAEKESCESFEKSVGDVTFKGMRFCTNFSLEFVTLQTDDPASIEKALAAMKPDDCEMVLTHQLNTLDRLIGLQEKEDKNRATLRAERRRLKDQKGATRSDKDHQNGASETDKFYECQKGSSKDRNGATGSDKDPQKGATGTQSERHTHDVLPLETDLLSLDSFEDLSIDNPAMEHGRRQDEVNIEARGGGARDASDTDDEGSFYTDGPLQVRIRRWPNGVRMTLEEMMTEAIEDED